MFNLASLLLQTLAAKVTRSSDEPFKSLENMTNDEKGKIRYVGGWVMRKVSEKSKAYIKANITSRDSVVRKNIKKEIMKVKITDMLITSSSALTEHSKYKESLCVTANKQNRTQGLLNIVDTAFVFFSALEESRVNLLTKKRLDQLRGDLVVKGIDTVMNDKTIFDKWGEMVEKYEVTLTDNNAERLLLFKDCSRAVFDEIVQKYFKMGTGEFLRDFRREVHFEKSEAHRQKVRMRVAKKSLLADHLSIEDIKADQTPCKMKSHSALKAMVLKHPRIFHETRPYIVKDLNILLKAYGVQQKGKKALLADKLVELIKSKDQMVHPTCFDS